MARTHPLRAGLVRLACMAAVVVGMTATPAIALASNFVKVPHAAPLADSRTHTLLGEMGEDGCEYPPDELVLPAGWDAIERREIAYDPVACRMVVEDGRPSATTRARKFDFNRTIGDRSTSAPQRQMHDERASSVSESGYYAVWFEDKFEFLVNVVQSNVWWTYTPGGCVTGGGGNGQLGALAASGWKLIGGTDSHSNDRTCTRQRSVTAANFKNQDFCSPATVKVKYFTVRAKGNNGGAISGYNNTNVLNPCDPPFHLAKHSMLKKY